MIDLRRTVRFCINDPPQPDAGKTNTFAGWPPARGLARYYEIAVHCRGEIDPLTGYFLNIKIIDDAVRGHAVPILEQAAAEERASRQPCEPRLLLPELFRAVDHALNGSVQTLTWFVTPFLTYSREADMNASIIKESFEFAASHRLHCPEMSDEENRALYGKCNHASGHGHNYKVDVSVRVPDKATERFDLEAFERLVNEHVINRFDHRYLNVDCEEFADRIPSVENIAVVAFEILTDALRDAGMELHEVTVWETDKTSATYRG